MRARGFFLSLVLVTGIPLQLLSSEVLLASWNTHGLQSSPVELEPTSVNSNISIHQALSLGPGLSPGSLVNAWGSANNFNQTSLAEAVSSGQYFSVHLGQVSGGDAITFDRILFHLRLTQEAFENEDFRVHVMWQFSRNGVTFTDVGFPIEISAEALGSWNTSGFSFNRFLGSTPPLQQGFPRSIFRLVAWWEPTGDSEEPPPSFALNFGRLPGADLEFRGTFAEPDKVSLVSWNPHGLTESPDSFNPTMVGEDIQVLQGLTRGPGLGPGSLNNAWGSGSQFNSQSMLEAIDNGEYFTFSIQSNKPGSGVTLERLNTNIRLIESVYNENRVHFVWQIQRENGPFHTIGTPVVLSPETTGNWNTAGVSLPAQWLRGELHPLVEENSLTFRLVSWSELPGAYAVNFGRSSGPDLNLTGSLNQLRTPPTDMDGVILSELPTPPSVGYVGSPSLAQSPSGDLFASHDLFNSFTQEDTVRVFRSSDSGETWKRVSTVYGLFWATLFWHSDALYLYGYSRGASPPRLTYLRQSVDEGLTWSDPVVLSTTGGGTPATPVIFNDRLWFAHRATQTLSVPVDADLMEPSSWSISPVRPSSGSWLDGQFDFWSEAQIAASPDTGVVILPKVHNFPYTGRIRVTDPTTSAFDAGEDFFFFPGGEKKFAIQYDPVWGRFIALTNPVLSALSEIEEQPSLMRNTLALLSSTDLVNWQTERILLFSPHWDYEAFQYPNFLVDGEDLIFVSRTALDMGGLKPTRGHDSNLMTFHRLEGFRDSSREQFLIVDGSELMRFERTLNNGLAPLEPFTDFDLDWPVQLFRGEGNSVFIKEDFPGGRFMEFDGFGFLRNENISESGLVLEGSQSSVQSIDQGVFPQRPLSSVAQWRLEHFGIPHGVGLAGDKADPDGDGIPNIFEYAFHGNPFQPSSAQLPVLNRLSSTSGSGLFMEFPKRSHSTMHYVVEDSVDLESWTEYWNSATAHPVPESGNIEIPIPSEESRFFRVRIQK